MALSAKRRDLVLGAQAGDGAAVERLLAERQGDLRRYAMRHCALSEIDDAVQETLLIVTRQAQSLKSAASFAGWLFTIVRRECGRLSRRMFAHEDIGDAAIEAALARRTDETLRLELAAAIESLPAHYREIVLLRDFEEMTMAEICRRLGLSIASGKSRLRRARLLIREFLVEEGT